MLLSFWVSLFCKSLEIIERFLLLDHCLLYVFILTCLIGSAAIFGSNCMDLILAAWNTNKADAYLDAEVDYPGQDFCFRFLSEDDQIMVKEEQQAALTAMEENLQT